MLFELANPKRFMEVSGPVLPWLGGATAACLIAGLALGFTTPPDYQQGDTVRIMFLHVPAAWTAMMAYGLMAVASAVGLINRHPLADVAAKTAAPLGAVFTALGLITGSLWGKPMWGAWWVWDGRLTSFLLLLLLYLGYIALGSAIEDENQSARACAILAIVGAVNLPIIEFSVDWWTTLHQGESILRKGGPLISPVFLWPLFLMGIGYTLLFSTLWIVRIRTEILNRRVRTLMLARAA
ncbi:MAG: heme ABC transporter permease [Alphaproteobacteria bacterium]|nr:heme ABC transporter permease [Alphaproteobacteria bacterium]MDE2111027.1 heme ABC transporter permease [Alphaproteobacteria bacterium]MDE2493812.1 heme ABC transporter permease [Alphaproteobacteria bacterium]